MVKNSRKNKFFGFTLIELLVVISLIGFLTTLAVIALNYSRIRARNIKRNADIVQLIKAFQQAVDKSGGQLPAVYSACLSTSCGCAGDNEEINTFIGSYFKKPTDPNPSGVDCWGLQYYGNNGNPYLYWQLERAPITPDRCGPGRVVNAITCRYYLNL